MTLRLLMTVCLSFFYQKSVTNITLILLLKITVTDLRQELQRKRNVRMNNMYRNELDALEAQNPNIKGN